MCIWGVRGWVQTVHSSIRLQMNARAHFSLPTAGVLDVTSQSNICRLMHPSLQRGVFPLSELTLVVCSAARLINCECGADARVARKLFYGGKSCRCHFT